MKTSDKKQAELDYLLKRCLIFHDFFYKKYYSNKEDLIKRGLPGFSEVYKNMRTTLEEAYQKGNLIVLRAGNKEYNSELREMPTKDMLELVEILKKELGEDFSIVEKKRLDAINRVIKRGKISNLTEYRLLSERADEIYDDPDRIEELEAVNSLLIAFDSKGEINKWKYEELEFGQVRLLTIVAPDQKKYFEINENYENGELVLSRCF